MLNLESQHFVLKKQYQVRIRQNSNYRMKMSKEASTLQKSQLTKKGRPITQNNSRNTDINVNRFLHVLGTNTITQKDIDWMLSLRSKESRASTAQIRQKLIPFPPEVANKQTICSKNKHTPADLEGVPLSQIQHLIRRTPKYQQSSGLINFQASLRCSENKNIQRQRQWTTLPKKDRKEPTRFLTKQNVLKMNANDSDLEPAFDGYQNYPKYSQKSLKQRNYNKFRHLLKGQRNFNTLLWQVSLRS